MSIEEEHQEVLQNLEAVVADCYRKHPELTDFRVQTVYDAVTDFYRAEERGGEPRDFMMSKVQEELAMDLISLSNVFLGRAEFETEDGEPSERIEDPIDLAILIRCLRKLQKSLPKWSKRGGRQGYLNFISNFV